MTRLPGEGGEAEPDIQLFLDAEQADGTLTSQGFAGLGLDRRLEIRVIGCGTPAAREHVETLRAAIEAELIGSSGARLVESPRGDPGAESGSGQGLLVLVGDGAEPFAFSETIESWIARGPGHTILPVQPLEARTRTTSLVPAELSELNVDFWSGSPAEASHAIFARTGLSADQARIFISYRQTETAALAMQLFDALSHEGFDVFLDHFRIPPGVDFQSRLTQELGDKSMVVILESPDILSSQWILYEINVAKTCGLGLFALTLPRGRRVAAIDDELRHGLVPGDLDGPAGPAAELVPEALARVVGRLKREHDRALIRRRAIIRASFEDAVIEAGGGLPRLEAPGCLRVEGAGRDYLVQLPPRPPDLIDFHVLHGAARPPATGVILGLSRLMEPPRAARNAWLSGLCGIRLVDEGEMRSAARMMVQGNLA